MVSSCHKTLAWQIHMLHALVGTLTDHHQPTPNIGAHLVVDVLVQDFDQVVNVGR